MILAMMGAPSPPAMIMMLPAQFSTSCTHAMIVLYFALARCALCDCFALAQIHLNARCALCNHAGASDESLGLLQSSTDDF